MFEDGVDTGGFCPEEIAQGLTAAEVLASDDGTQSAARWRSGP